MTKLLGGGKKGNTKMVKTGLKWGVPVYTFSIPAFKSAEGFKTCPMAGKCAKPCYARVGRYAMPVIKNAQEYRLSVSRGPDFEGTMSAEIYQKLHLKPRVLQGQYRGAIRIHDSGDFYDKGYLLKWLHLIERHPDVLFYCYTKRVSLFKDMADPFPGNFKSIFSFGGLQDALIDTKVDRHAKVFQNANQARRAGYVDCSHDDLKAVYSKSNRIGLIYHGIARYKMKNRPTLGV
jgi:hypothetical protein